MPPRAPKPPKRDGIALRDPVVVRYRAAADVSDEERARLRRALAEALADLIRLKHQP